MMKKIAVVYWSGTGNTEIMAEKIVEGAKSKGAIVSLFTASQFDTDKINDFDVIAFGCPSMGAEQLEESEFEPMFESCRPYLQGKNIALFGSYGWGDGEWMRDWEDICRSDGAIIIAESLIVNETPHDSDEESCVEFGKDLF